MEAVRVLRQLYSLDTLDTRLTTPAKPSKASEARSPQTTPSKWRTTEYYFYYAVILCAVPQMIASAMGVSQGELLA